MSEPERKGIKILSTVHKELYMERARTGVPIYELVARAWELYKRPHAVAKHQEHAAPSAKEQTLIETILAMSREHDPRMKFIQNYVDDYLYWKHKK